MRELTIRDLVAEPRLGLRLISGNGATSRRLDSAHVCDLPHPGRYVLPGELLLTNGLWLGKVPAEKWVAEVRDAGAMGIGFGLSSKRRAVPERLLAACLESGFPLIEVPEEISFALVSNHVHERTAGYATAVLRRQLLRTRDIVQRLAAEGGHTALLDVLSAETTMAAAFIGPGGRVIAATGEPPPRETARLASLAALHGQLPSAVGDNDSVFGVAGLLPISVLLVREPMRDIPDEARLVIEQVAAYGAFEDARARALEAARRTMAEELVSLVLADEVGEAAFSARVRTLQLDPAKPVCPIASDVPIELLRYAAEATGVPYAIAQLECYQLLLLEDPLPELPGALAAAIRDAGGEPVLGCARPAAGVSALRRSLAEAAAGLQLARSREDGERVVREAEIGSHALLLRLLEPHDVDAYRNAVLAPLKEWDREHGSALVETLRTFLELGGHWREAAAVLHIHHNTLRYRLERVEELTGRELSSTADRVDLFLALVANGSGRPRAGD